MSTAHLLELDNFPQTAVPLLREYSERVDAQRRDLRRLQESFDRQREGKDQLDQNLSRQLLTSELETTKTLIYALRRFCQRVSQHLEHESPSLTDRVELELRLADVERSVEALRSDREAIATWFHSL
jgi:hypothetical protein